MIDIIDRIKKLVDWVPDIKAKTDLIPAAIATELAELDAANIPADVDALTAAITQLINAGIAVSGSVNDAMAADWTFVTNLAEATNDHYNGSILLFTEGALKGQSRMIGSYTGASKTVTFLLNPFTEAPADGDDFVIIPSNGSYLQYLLTYMTFISDSHGLTTYGTRTAVATNANGVTWVDLVSTGVLANAENIWGVTLTIAGGWAGLCQFRIVTSTGTKIFPFAAQAEENTDFVSAVPWMFFDKIVIPVGSGYKVQFRSSNAGDGEGKTCALTELDVIARG